MTMFDQLEADLTLLQEYEDETTNVLAAGCTASPPEIHRQLLEAFGHYHRYLNPRSRLFLLWDECAGTDDCFEEMNAFIHQAGLADVVILIAEVLPAQLKAYYLMTHAFLCLSRCPQTYSSLVLARDHQIPIVGWSTPEARLALGEESLLWEDGDSSLIAQSLHYCLQNPEAADYLIEHQRTRSQKIRA